MNKIKETIAQKAYRLLSTIPSENWLTGAFTNQKNSCCARGHIMRLSSNNPEDYTFDNCKYNSFIDDALILSVMSFLKNKRDFICINEPLSSINDNDYNLDIYTEKTPKERILHLLTDMIEAGY